MAKKKNTNIYSDYIYIGTINDKLVLVKEVPNFKSLISNKEFDNYMGVYLFKDLKDPNKKYKRDEFTTLDKLNDLEKETRNHLLNLYFNNRINENKENNKKINKIYSLRYRLKNK